jgi:hypothetical protein
MISGRVKEDKIKSGEELRLALAASCENEAFRALDNAMLNRLLDFAQMSRDDPKRDPLELKQSLAAISPSLGALKLRQRKAMMVALENHIALASRHNLPERLFVDGGWRPKEPEPEPPRAAPKQGMQVMISPSPLSGEGEGFTWTQTETELTITVCLPEGTQKQEVAMQMTPKFGPSQQLVVRCRFWPLPLLSGVLHHAVDASEATWHLDSNCKVTIDLPKMVPQLWKGTPPVFASGAGPLAEYALPGLPAGSGAAEDAATGGGGAPDAAGGGCSTALIAGVAPESVVQKMGQRPTDLALQLQGCAVLGALLDADPGKGLAAANARAIPVLLRILRLHGHQSEVQLAAWRPLLQMVAAHPYLRKVLLDAGCMRLVLSGLDACRADPIVLTQLCLVARSLLPSTPPRPFVESGGLELIVEAMLTHPGCAPLLETGGACLHMLSGVNHIVRRMILRMEVVPTMLALCTSEPCRDCLHEVTLGLVAQLSRGDASCAPLFRRQVQAAGLLEALRRFPAAPELQADGARALATLVGTEEAVLTFIAEGGLEHLLQVRAGAGELSTVVNEVANVLEQAVCTMCEAIDEEAPEDELDAISMAELLREMAEAAHERRRRAAEAKREAEERAREEAEACRRVEEALEKARVEEIEAAPTAYAGFRWGSSFDDPRLLSAGDAPDPPRIVELDND